MVRCEPWTFNCSSWRRSRCCKSWTCPITPIGWLNAGVRAPLASVVDPWESCTLTGCSGLTRAILPAAMACMFTSVASRVRRKVRRDPDHRPGYPAPHAAIDLQHGYPDVKITELHTHGVTPLRYLLPKILHVDLK